MKDQVASKIKLALNKYRNALDLGKQNGAGRIAVTFYNNCNEILRGQPAAESLKLRIESNLEGIEEGELSNASLGPDDNEGRNLDDKEHCKAPCRLSMKSEERQSQNKSYPSHSTRSNIFREQRKEILNKRIHKKLTKELPKFAM